MSDNDIDINRVRERVKQRLQRRSPFRVVLIAFFAVMLASAISFLVQGITASAPTMTMVGGDWGHMPWGELWLPILMIIIFASLLRRVIGSSRRNSTPSERDIDRAIRRELHHEQRRLYRRDWQDWADKFADEYRNSGRYTDRHDRYQGDYEYDDDYDDPVEAVPYEKRKRTDANQPEKRKNEPAVRLGDDGELLFEDEPAHNVEDEPQRRASQHQR